MAQFTLEVATEYNFPNITVYKKLWDGVQSGWRFVSNEGCVMYDTTANNTELDPETMIERPVIYYYTNVDCPLNYNFDNFAFKAISINEVDKKYIF